MKRKFVIAISALLFLCVMFTLASCGFLKDKGYYDMGKDRITSMGGFAGERKMTGVETSISNGVATNIYKYQTDPQIKTQAVDDVYGYIFYLVEKENFIFTIDIPEFPDNGGIDIQLAKESADAGKIIVLEIDYKTSGYTLTFSKFEGTLTYYDD